MNPYSLSLNDIQVITTKALRLLFDDSLTYKGSFSEYYNSFLTSTTLIRNQPPPINLTADLLSIAYPYSNQQLKKRFSIIPQLEVLNRSSNYANPVVQFSLTLSILDTGVRQENGEIDDKDYTQKIYDILGNSIGSGISSKLFYDAQKSIIQNQLTHRNNFLKTNFQKYVYDFHKVDKTKMKIINHDRNNQTWQLDTILFFTVSVNGCETINQITNNLT